MTRVQNHKLWYYNYKEVSHAFNFYRKAAEKEREKRESKIKLQHVIGKVNRSHHEVHVQTVIAGGARDDVTLVGGRKDGDV